MAIDLLGRLIADNITEFGRSANELGYDVPAEQEVSFILATAEASSTAPDASLVRTNIFSAAAAAANAEAPTAELIRYKVLGLFPALADAEAAEANLWAMPKFEPAAAAATAIAPAAEMKTTQLLPNPFALQLYATENGLPITTLYEFENLTYSRSENEAGQVQITFPANHPANKAIRDIYTAEPHGIYGILYRRGEPWAGVILAETDITTSPISWSFLTFEALLREHKTPWKWHGLEGLTIQQAITALCEKGLKWHQVASAEGLAAATLSDTEIKTWAQLAGEVESGAYNQPMIVLGKTGTQYKTSGTATFAWDFGDQVPLDRIRWRCSLGEYVSLAVQYRCSPDNVSWTAFTDEAAVADQDYAETYGIAAAGTYRYLEVKFTFRTEDTTTKDQAGNAVGTSPVLFGVEAITSYDTGIDAYSIDVADEALKRGFDFSHENHLAAIASICEDYGYRFRIDEQRRLYVWQPAATAPIIVKKGETCEPTAISYQGLSGIENSLTCYGAGEGLGRLSVLAEDSTSVAIYGRRPGIFEDSKITTLTALQEAATDELYKRAYPVLEAQIRAPYEPGRGVLDARLHDYILYIDPETFTGSDNLGQALFEVTAESREFTADGEMVTLGLNSSLDDMFTREAKDGVRSRYKRGKAVGQVPFDVRAIAGFAAINILWHGIAPEYIVEYSSTGTDGWKALARTAERSYLHSQLASGATFYYRVRAVYNGTEITGPSLVVSATTTLIEPGDLDTTAPAVPTGLAASTGTTQSTAGGIVMLNTLTWNAVVATDLSFYELRRSLDEIAWITAAIVPAGEITFIDTAGLVENTNYKYQIRAVDKVGNRSDWSASASVTTVKDATSPTFADTPPEVTAGFKRLVPRWVGSTSADISHYILERQEIPASWSGTTWETPKTALTNIITNGDFSNGTTGWNGSGGVTPSASNGEAYFTAAARYGSINQPTQPIENYKGHKLYFAFRLKTDSQNVLAYLNDGTTQVAAAHLGDNVFRIVSNVMTVSNNATELYSKVQDNRESGWTEVRLGNVIVIDLTAGFGAGHEPSKEQVDAMLAKAYPSNSWFDGTGLIPETAFGRVATNKILNGDFRGLTSWWNAEASTITAANNTLSITGNGTQAYVRVYSFFDNLLISGRKYYARAKVRVTNGNCSNIMMFFDASQHIVTQATPAANTWYEVSGVVTASATRYVLDLYHYYADSATANGKVLEVQNVLVVDLEAAFGAGNEPTKSEMDAIMAEVSPTNSWFDRSIVLPTSVAPSLPNARAVNFILGANLDNSLNGWTQYGATLSRAANTILVTGSGTEPYATGRKNIPPLIVGHKYYARAKARVTNANCLALMSFWTGSQLVGSVSNPAINTWYVVSGVTEAASAFSIFDIYHYYADSATASGKVMEIQKVLAVDLTETFGAGFEPTKSEFEAMLAAAYPTDSWFEHIAYFADTSGAWQIDTLKSATNLVPNGSFPNTTGWTPVDSSLAVASNTMSCTGLGGGANPYLYASLGQQIITTGRKLYVRLKIRLTNSDATLMRIFLINASTRLSVANYFTVNTPVANEWYDVAFLATLNTTTAGAALGISIQTLYPTKELAIGKVMQVQYVSVLDLTSMFGAGNEPHEALIDAIIGDASPITHWFQSLTTMITGRNKTEWEPISDSAIRALQYHDTDVEFDYAYRYRVSAVDTSGNTSAYTAESAWAVPSQIGTTDAAYRFITAEMYGELRNVLPYTWRQDIDSTHPIEVPFYIPSETTQIVSVKLSAYGERFRANSTAASAGGSHSHSLTLANHNHSVGYTITSGDGSVLTGSAGSHDHSASGTAAAAGDHSHMVAGATDTVQSHSHSVDGTTYFDGEHGHTVSAETSSDGAHTHSQQYTTVNSTTGNGGGVTQTSSSQDAHTHDITYGIYESTTPAGMNLYIDSGAGYGSAIALTSAPVSATERYELAEELDITAHIAGTGWKRLKLTSTRLGSVEMQLICKVDITA